MPRAKCRLPHYDDDDDVSVAILVHKKVTGSFAPDSQTDAGTMSEVAGNSAFIYLGERSDKERTLLANPDASRPAVASDDAAQPTLERTEGWRPEGAGETLVANSCGAPQPAVARDDAALLALKNRPVEKT